MATFHSSLNLHSLLRRAFFPEVGKPFLPPKYCASGTLKHKEPPFELSLRDARSNLAPTHILRKQPRKHTHESGQHESEESPAAKTYVQPDGRR